MAAKGFAIGDGWGCIGVDWVSPAGGCAGGNNVVSGAPVGWWYSRVAAVMVWVSGVPGGVLATLWWSWLEVTPCVGVEGLGTG